MRYSKINYTADGNEKRLLMYNDKDNFVKRSNVVNAIMLLNPHQRVDIGKTVEVTEEQYNHMMTELPDASTAEEIAAVNEHISTPPIITVEYNQRKSMTIYLDFDGTVVEHDYPRMGRVNFGCMEVIRKLQNAGHTIILNTYRSDLKNGVEDALKLLNEQAWMCQDVQPDNFDDAEFYEDFALDTIESTTKKIQPQQWDIETAIREDIMFIDDIAPNIPLKPAVMVKGNMVNWDTLDKQFQQYRIY